MPVDWSQVTTASIETKLLDYIVDTSLAAINGTGNYVFDLGGRISRSPGTLEDLGDTPCITGVELVGRRKDADSSSQWRQNTLEIAVLMTIPIDHDTDAPAESKQAEYAIADLQLAMETNQGQHGNHAHFSELLSAEHNAHNGADQADIYAVFGVHTDHDRDDPHNTADLP